MSVEAGIWCLCVLALLSGATLSDVNVASYPRWRDTRFPGTIVFSEQVGSVLQCGGVCGTFGAACMVFTVQKVDDGVRCDIVQEANSPVAAAGFHSYTSSRYVGASDKKPHYFFARSAGEWENSPAACARVRASTNCLLHRSGFMKTGGCKKRMGGKKMDVGDKFVEECPFQAAADAEERLFLCSPTMTPGC
ncbi:uncharacterized protein LOC119598098 [Penaeus monodon]|uniref:uncharacterized protein LOC119598098 n=1 Tax=Penaeus monodon TaxID=6687 RepID=UPI0018A76331|nr:uncharacterized protein LOC119598098 [Penaeus monodon]